ncbi:MAG TPA: PadR family transcriptional regulator [Phototrophicaceae bacterium]|nr:PadR family transcriptional regulator [Phototrophicaceae bacterium]
MEQTTMSEAELTILSLLSESARYGHELQKVIEERGLREWVAIGFSSIFYLLNKLEHQHMIAGELQPDPSGVARKRYSLTDAGRGVLQTAVADLLRQPHAFGSGFELGLANLGVLKPPQIYLMLTHHRADLKQRLETVERSWERHQREETPADYIRALYTHSISVMKAELEWMTGFIEDWVKRYPGVEKPATQPTRPAEGDTHRAQTALARRPTPDPAKLIQKLKRPPKQD